jgi:hypothetical protein
MSHAALSLEDWCTLLDLTLGSMHVQDVRARETIRHLDPDIPYLREVEIVNYWRDYRLRLDNIRMYKHFVGEDK